jgi:predicted RNA-binding protein with TRAM domain
MKNAKGWNKMFLVAAMLVFGLVLAGCNVTEDPDADDGDEDLDKVSPPTTYTTLTDNIWADGDIIKEGGEQWFMFTATASTQYIHVSFGTLPGSYDGLYVQLYNSAGVSVSSRAHLYGETRSSSYSVTIGNVYYVKVQAGSSSDTGTFRIGFNIYSNWNPGSFPPVNPTTLTDNTWAAGDITTAGGSQWFTFTATASTQHIHAKFGTLRSGDGLYVQLYNSDGVSVSSRTHLYSSTNSSSQPVTTGKVYYVRVQTYSSSTGTFWIGFNIYDNWAPGSFPPVNPTALATDTWADGDITTAGGSQWFTFTATANTQYIHASFGTLRSSDGLYVQLYNSAGNSASSRARLYGSTQYISYPLTNGTMYYVRVQAYSSSGTGTYRIAFNTSDIAPLSP